MDLAVLARFGLLLVRPAMVIAVAPGLGGVFVPAPAKIGLTVLIAVALMPTVPVPPAAQDMALTMLVAREAAIGLSLAFVLKALVSAAELAGHLSGFQMGFSYGATIDPQSGVRHNMLAALYGLLATLTLLGVNGHHALLRALAESYRALPLGPGGIDESLVVSVREILGLVFVTGLRLAAPIIVVMLVVELTIGLISRAAPALGSSVIGYPLRILIGLLLLGALTATVPDVIHSLIERAVGMGARTAVAFR